MKSFTAILFKASGHPSKVRVRAAMLRDGVSVALRRLTLAATEVVSIDNARSASSGLLLTVASEDAIRYSGLALLRILSSTFRCCLLSA